MITVTVTAANRGEVGILDGERGTLVLCAGSGYAHSVRIVLYSDDVTQDLADRLLEKLAERRLAKGAT